MAILTLEQLNEAYQLKKELEGAEKIASRLVAEIEDESDLIPGHPYYPSMVRYNRLRKQVEAMAGDLKDTLSRIKNARGFLICDLHFRAGYTYAAIGKILQDDPAIVRQSAYWAIARAHKNAMKETEENKQ